MFGNDDYAARRAAVGTVLVPATVEQHLAPFGPTWIALNAALGDFHEWRSEYRRCAFVERATGRGLVIEAEDEAGLRIACRAPDPAKDDLEELAVWAVTLSADNGVCTLASPTGASAGTLNDALWAFHRLAVEDAASMLLS